MNKRYKFNNRHQLMAEFMTAAACKYFGVELSSRSRKRRDYVDPRHMTVHWLNDKFDLTLSGIGKIIKRDHTSVINCKKQHLDLMVDPKYKRRFDEYAKHMEYVFQTNFGSTTEDIYLLTITDSRAKAQAKILSDVDLLDVFIEERLKYKYSQTMIKLELKPA